MFLVAFHYRQYLNDVDLALQFDPFASTWQNLCAKFQVYVFEEKVEILIALEDLGKAKASSNAGEVYIVRCIIFQHCSLLWVKGPIWCVCVFPCAMRGRSL